MFITLVKKVKQIIEAKAYYNVLFLFTLFLYRSPLFILYYENTHYYLFAISSSNVITCIYNETIVYYCY